MCPKKPMKRRSRPSSGDWDIRYHLRPGDLDQLTELHGVLYAKEYGYNREFEEYVAEGLAGFAKSPHPEKNRIWLAEKDGRVIGSIAGVASSESEAQLRWYLVHPEHRGLGLGRELMKEALQFCREKGYRTVFLWTTSELSAARHLYTNVGFRKTEEKTHTIWGKKVTEERYDLLL